MVYALVLISLTVLVQSPQLSVHGVHVSSQFAKLYYQRNLAEKLQAKLNLGREHSLKFTFYAFEADMAKFRKEVTLSSFLTDQTTIRESNAHCPHKSFLIFLSQKHTHVFINHTI